MSVAAWPQGTPVDVDPALVVHDTSVPLFFVTIAISLSFAAFAFTAPGLRWLAVAPWPLLGVTLAHAAGFAINVWVIGPDRFVQPSFWPWRLFSYGVTFVLSTCYGAGSLDSASPAYVLALSSLPHFARVAPGSMLLALLMLIAPLLARLGFVAPVDGPSLVVAIAVGVLSAALYLRASGLAMQALRLAMREEAERTLGEEALLRAAQLRVAMSLHDGLAGALCGVRHRLAAGLPDTELRELVDRLLDRTRQVTGALPVRTSDDLGQQLRGSLAAHRIEHRITIARRRPTLLPDELGDMHAIAYEVVSNAIKNHATFVAVRIAFGRRRTSFTAESRESGPAGPVPGTGRGLRNIALRAHRRGGQAHGGPVPGGWRMVAFWPAGQGTMAPRWFDLVAEPALLALFAGSLWCVSRAPLTLAIFLGIAVAYVWHLRRGAALIQRQREACAQTNSQHRAAEQSGVLGRTRDELCPLATQLEGALATNNLRQVPALLDQLAGRIAVLLENLESPGAAESAVSANDRCETRP